MANNVAAGARGDADLLEDVLDVVAGGLHGDVEAGGDLLVGEAARQDAQHLHLAIREAGRMVGPGRQQALVSRHGEHGGHGLAVETAGGGIAAEFLGGARGREGGAVRALLDHGVVGVGRGEQARGHRDGGGGEAAVIAGAVEALVRERGDGAHRAEPAQAREDALRVVRVHANALPLGLGERALLVPDALEDAGPAEVVEVRSAHESGALGPASTCSAAALASAATAAECPRV
jgi:hypothetical protein